jgi:hypothetical protein
MLKKFLTTVYLLALTATPVNAAPFWAEAIAIRHCQYLITGADWETAIEQSLRDYWAIVEQVPQDTLSKTIVYAVEDACPSLNNAAYQRYKQQSRPAFRNQESQTF